MMLKSMQKKLLNSSHPEEKTKCILLEVSVSTKKFWKQLHQWSRHQIHYMFCALYQFVHLTIDYH